MKCEVKNGKCGAAKSRIFILLLAFLCGCATPKHFVGTRRFDFQKDTFAYANGLVWEYHFNQNGKWVHQRREPPPDYTLHCFVIARAARQFFQNTRFDPSLPVADEATYRDLINHVVWIDPTRVLPESKRIVIPGYADLHRFSQAQEKLLQSECGGAWESYLQRGNWRMIFPFSRNSQKRTAEGLIAGLKQNRPPVVHLVRFPQLTINHSVLVFDAKEAETDIQFSIYDPNQPAGPRTLIFDRATETFIFPANNYFSGGRVDVYEIYRNGSY